MKGLGLSITPIGAGLRTDLEKMRSVFRGKKSLRWQTYSLVFKDMKMSLLWSGRQSESELREFSLMALTQALEYCVDESADQQTIVFGIYTLYAFYYLQPSRYRMKIRVTFDTLDKLRAMAETFKRGQHFDVLYVLHRLNVEQAFHVCAFMEEFNPLNMKKFDNAGTEEEMRADHFRGESLPVRDLADDYIVHAVGQAHREYMESKEKLCGGEPTSSLQMVRENPSEYLISRAEECVARIDQRTHQKGRTTSESTDSKSPVKNRRAQLKAQAYSGVAKQAKHRRHRQDPKGEFGKKGKESDPNDDNDEENTVVSPKVGILSPRRGLKGKPRGRRPKVPVETQRSADTETSESPKSKRSAKKPAASPLTRKRKSETEKEKEETVESKKQNSSKRKSQDKKATPAKKSAPKRQPGRPRLCDVSTPTRSSTRKVTSGRKSS